MKSSCSLANAFIIVLAMLIILTPAASAQSGGDYELTWASINGGGGEMTGGAYSLVSTIGQPEAGVTQSGGGYSLNGGVVDAGDSVMASDQQIFLPLIWR